MTDLTREQVHYLYEQCFDEEGYVIDVAKEKALTTLSERMIEPYADIEVCGHPHCLVCGTWSKRLFKIVAGKVVFITESEKKEERKRKTASNRR